MDSTSSNCCNFDDMRVTFDQACEYIPFVSTFTMIIGAIQKHLYVPDMERDGSLKENHYYTHLKNKDFENSWPLFIPGVNFVVKMCPCCSPETPVTLAHSPLTHVSISDEDISSEELTESEEEANNSEIEEKNETKEQLPNMEDCAKSSVTFEKEQYERNKIALTDQELEIKREMLLKKSKTIEERYPDINIDELIQNHPHIDDVIFYAQIKHTFKEILYDIIIEEAPCFYLDSIQIKRVLTALNIFTCPYEIAKQLIALFNIIKLLSPNNCERLFNAMSNQSPDDYLRKNNLIAAGDFLIHLSSVDRTFALSLLEKMAEFPTSNLSISMFSSGTWKALNMLCAPVIHKGLISLNSPGSQYLPKEKQVDMALEIINKAFDLVGLPTASYYGSYIALIQILSKLKREDSNILFKIIRDLTPNQPSNRAHHLIQAADLIKKTSERGYPRLLTTLQQICDSPIRNILLQDWEAVRIFDRIAEEFPDQWKTIFNILINLTYEKILAYTDVNWASPDIKKPGKDIVKIINWSNIFMGPLSKPKWTLGISTDGPNGPKDSSSDDVIQKIAKIPLSQYRVFNEIFLGTIRDSTSIQIRLVRLDEALERDKMLQAYCLLFLANRVIFPTNTCNEENLGLIEVIKQRLLPMLVDVMLKNQKQSR